MKVLILYFVSNTIYVNIGLRSHSSYT